MSIVENESGNGQEAQGNGNGTDASPLPSKKGARPKHHSPAPSSASSPQRHPSARDEANAELNLTDICITPASALSGQGGMASVSQLGSEQTTPSGSERATLFQIVTPGGNGSGGEGDGRVGVEAAGECRGHPHDFSESTGYDRSNSSISKDGSMLFRVLPPAGTGSGNGTASSGGTQTPGRGQSISTSTFQVQFASSLTGIPREVAGGAGAGGGGTGGGGGVDLSTAGPLPLPRQHASPVALSGYHGPLNQSTTSANSIMNSSADSRRALREDVECYHLPPE